MVRTVDVVRLPGDGETICLPCVAVLDTTRNLKTKDIRPCGWITEEDAMYIVGSLAFLSRRTYKRTARDCHEHIVKMVEVYRDEYSA